MHSAGAYSTVLFMFLPLLENVSYKPNTRCLVNEFYKIILLIAL